MRRSSAQPTHQGAPFLQGRPSGTLSKGRGRFGRLRPKSVRGLPVVISRTSSQARKNQTPPSANYGPTPAQQPTNEFAFSTGRPPSPSVWRHWQNQVPEGGFDAVIGNPPWDRIKLQEVEWFATRDPDLARAYHRTPPAARASSACANGATHWPKPLTRPRPAPTASARSSAPPATTPCSSGGRHQPLLPLRRTLPPPRH